MEQHGYTNFTFVSFRINLIILSMLENGVYCREELFAII